MAVERFQTRDLHRLTDQLCSYSNNSGQNIERRVVLVFLGMMPTPTQLSHSVFLCVRWMWTWGKGCTSIHSAIHFIPLRGLDVGGGTKVIGLQIIRRIQQKAPQTAEECLHHPADRGLFTKSAAELPVSLSGMLLKNIWSCSSDSLIPAAVAQQGIYSWVQYGRGPLSADLP